MERPDQPDLPYAGQRAAAAEIPRLSRQCRRILDLLRRGPASNRELAALSLKYTGRISELRQAGYQIEVIQHDHATGLVLYDLTAEPIGLEVPP